MSAFEIEEELPIKKYRPIYGVNINLFFPGCGMSQHKGYPTKKHENVLLLNGVTFFIKKVLV